MNRIKQFFVNAFNKIDSGVSNVLMAVHLTSSRVQTLDDSVARVEADVKEVKEQINKTKKIAKKTATKAVATVKKVAKKAKVVV